jgi:hypothetical protein
MWNDEVCCASSLNSNNAPDFTSLAFLPEPTCDSASAQYIVQGLCLHQQNCSFYINSDSNHTYSWPITSNKPCMNDVQLMNVDGVETCQTSLSIPSVSNYSSCPQTKQRKLIVRAVCAAGTFHHVSWINEGKVTSREDWALGMSWLDALLNMLIFGVVVWMASKEEKAILQSDIACCSTDDFTLRIMTLPLPSGKTADLEKLRKNLMQYFNELLPTLPPVIMDRETKVKLRTHKRIYIACTYTILIFIVSCFAGIHTYIYIYVYLLHYRCLM